jgi:hypothetical protein
MTLVNYKVRTVLVLVALSFSQTLFGQTDSSIFVSAKWETSKISRGVRWKRYHFKSNLFNSNQYINILEVDNKSKTFAFGNDRKLLKPTSEFANESKRSPRLTQLSSTSKTADLSIF